MEKLKAKINYHFSAFYSYSQIRLLFILSELEKRGAKKEDIFIIEYR